MYNFPYSLSINTIFCLQSNPGNKYLTLKGLGEGIQFDPICGFSRNVSSRERMELIFLVTFNIIVSGIFSENFIKIPQVVQEIYGFSPPKTTSKKPQLYYG